MKRMAGALALTLALSIPVCAAPVASRDIQGGAPSGLTALEEGGYLFTDVYHNVLWSVDAEGTVEHLAGQFSVIGVNGQPMGNKADGSLETALFMGPWDIAPYLDGYAVSDPDAHVIRYVNLEQERIQTAAGSGRTGTTNGTGTSAAFSRPTGLAAGEDGKLYIADTDNGLIRCLDKRGKVTTFFSGLSEPTGLFWRDGALYVAETGAHCISKIERKTRTVVAGMEDTEGYVNGLSSAARLRSPTDVAVDEDGTLYIADTGNGAVRRLRDGWMTTLTDSAQEDGPVLPRSLLVQNDALLVADPFSQSVLELPLTTEVFSDVAEDAWYHDAVYAARDLGFIAGVGDGQFAPHAETSRAMLAVMLGRVVEQLDGDIVLAGSTELTDAAEEVWYGTEARWAVDLGILNAPGGQFEPRRIPTRQELALTLFKLANALGADTSTRNDLTAYEDFHAITSHTADAMAWANASGLITGTSDTLLDPNGSTTRAHMVQVLTKFLTLLQSQTLTASSP